MHDSFDSIPHNECDVIRHHSQSFSLAARLLPRNVRADVKKLYAWCRWCDNAVDDAPSRVLAAQRLLRLRLDVDLIYNNQEPIHAASAWLADLVRRYSIPKEYPLDLLEGMEMDVSHRPIQSQEDLLLYCHRAAGSVGQMMCFLLGTSNVQAISHADSLGMAMQMTNIARDVKEDQQSGRCYLPKCWLDADPMKEGLPTNENIQAAVKRLLALADEHYAIGIAGLQYLPSRSELAIQIAADLYREIGETIRRNDYRVMDGRTFVPMSRKVVLVVKGFLRSRHQTELTVPPVTTIHPFPFTPLS